MITSFGLVPCDGRWSSYAYPKEVFHFVYSKLVSVADGGIWKVYYIASDPYEWTSGQEPKNEIFVVLGRWERSIFGIYGTLSDDGSEHFRQLKEVYDLLVSKYGLQLRDPSSEIE